MTRGRCSRYLDWRTYSDSWTEKGFMMHTFTLMTSVFLGTVSEASKTGIMMGDTGCWLIFASNGRRMDI